MASITTMLGELGLPWVMTSYKEKKMSGGLYNSTIKKLCPQSRCGREDKCGLSCMSPVRTHEKQLQRATPRADHGSTWREQAPSRGLSATHCGEHSHTASLEGGSWSFLHPLNSPPRKTESPSSNFCLDSRVPSGASKDPLRRLPVCSQVCV